MIRKYFVLLRLQMLATFSINKTIHSKSNAALLRLILLAIGGFVLVGGFVAISYFISLGPALMGMADQLPIINLVTASLFIVVTTFLKASGVLFGHKDYDLVMSLPVNSFAVVLSRLTMVYIANLAFSLIIFGPAMVLYGIHGQPTLHGYIMYILAAFLAPMIPMIAVILVGTLLTAITSRFKYKNLLGIVLALAALGAYFYFIFTMDLPVMMTNIEQVADFGVVVSTLLGQFYPPAAWLSDGIVNANWLSFGLFALVSLGVFFLYTVVVSRFYTKINTRVSSFGKKRNFKLGTLKAGSPFMAMYKREARRITSNVTYALNAVMGPLITVAVAVIIAFVGPESFIGFLGLYDIPGLYPEDILNTIAQVSPLAIIFMVGIMPITAVALSLEGKNRWIMCSLPLPAITIFKSKIAMSISIMVPAAVIASTALVITLRPDPLTIAFMYLIPIVYCVFESVFAMYVNAKFPRYDWASEYQLLKGHSASIYIVLFGGMVLNAGFIFLAIVFFSHIMLIQVLILAVATIGTAVFYLLLRKEKLFA
ncbi:MAG: hypothetical protein FWC93_00740 [Defluviitaleaceae bacterium]|nr:hypothetical protein [Defluviitaleaceae bacterium]